SRLRVICALVAAGVVEWRPRRFERRMRKGMRVQAPPRAPSSQGSLQENRQKVAEITAFWAKSCQHFVSIQTADGTARLLFSRPHRLGDGSNSNIEIAAARFGSSCIAFA